MRPLTPKIAPDNLYNFNNNSSQHSPNYNSQTNLLSNSSYELSTFDNANKTYQDSLSPVNVDISKSRVSTGHHRRDPSAITTESSSNDDESLCSSLIGFFMILTVLLCILCTFPISMYFCFIIIHDHEKAVLFRNGRLKAVGGLGPGLVFVLPYIDQYCIIDCRTICYDIPPQKVLTKDSLTVDMDAVVLYRVLNAQVAITNVRSYRRATELLAATSLRNFLGTKTLTQILAESTLINDSLRVYLDAATEFWGVCIERIAIKNVKIPVELQHALSVEAQATREATAKYIAADGEKSASHELASAGLNLDDMAVQLRYLQTLNSISVKNNSTYIVPLPTELFQMYY